MQTAPFDFAIDSRKYSLPQTRNPHVKHGSLSRVDPMAGVIVQVYPCVFQSHDEAVREPELPLAIP